jgi:hypothetical protein
MRPVTSGLPRFVAPRLFLVLAAASALPLFAAAATNPVPPIPPSALSTYGWVLADLNGDQQIDLATASSARYDAGGYAQEVRVTLGGSQETSFRFQSRGANVELSTQDVDGDHDGDLIVFEPLSNQPIGVWLNDGAGSFHEGRLADFRSLWADRPGSSWMVRSAHPPLLAISENRTQTAVPNVVLNGHRGTSSSPIGPERSSLSNHWRGHSRTRGPPRNS